MQYGHHTKTTTSINHSNYTSISTPAKQLNNNNTRRLDQYQVSAVDSLTHKLRSTNIKTPASSTTTRATGSTALEIIDRMAKSSASRRRSAMLLQTTSGHHSGSPSSLAGVRKLKPIASSAPGSYQTKASNITIPIAIPSNSAARSSRRSLLGSGSGSSNNNSSSIKSVRDQHSVHSSSKLASISNSPRISNRKSVTSLSRSTSSTNSNTFTNNSSANSSAIVTNSFLLGNQVVGTKYSIPQKQPSRETLVKSPQEMRRNLSQNSFGELAHVHHSSSSNDAIQDHSNSQSVILHMATQKRHRKHIIQRSIPRVKPAVHVVGLENLGNTCFMNSALQCLFSVEWLILYFLEEDYYSHDINKANSQTKGQLADAFALLVRDVWRKYPRTVAPTILKRQFERYAPDHFSGNRQQDAQEFLRFLLDGLHEDLNRVRVKPKLLFDEKLEDSLSLVQRAQLAWNRYHALNDSFIFDMFGGQLQSTIQCLSCNYESHTFDTFWDLSLPIPKKFQKTKSRLSLSSISMTTRSHCTLEDCLDTFAEREILEGDESYNCSRCKSPQRATKCLRIYRYPTILMIHIKRFTQTRQGRDKLTTEVMYPESINTGLQSIQSESEGHDHLTGQVYCLIGICTHSGGLGGGHYVAHAKSIEDGRWYCFNDSHVSESSPNGHSAYILFYQRCNQ